MDDTRRLRSALLANAVFSAGCALFMIVNPVLTGELLGIQAPLILRGIGLALLIFAADLVHQATRPVMALWRAYYASAADLLWVLGTFIGLYLFPGVLSATGLIIVLAVAGVVFVCAIWQLCGIRLAGENRTTWI